MQPIVTLPALPNPGRVSNKQDPDMIKSAWARLTYTNASVIGPLSGTAMKIQGARKCHACQIGSLLEQSVLAPVILVSRPKIGQACR